MFDRHYRVYSRILLAADVVSVLPALLIAYYARPLLVRLAPGEFSGHFNPILLPLQDYFGFLFLSLPVWLGALLLTQHYETLLRRPLSRQAERLLYFIVLAGSAMGLLSFALKLEVSRPVFFTFFGMLLGLLLANRIAFHLVLRSRNINEHNQVRILIVGTDRSALRVGEILESARKWGYHVVGYVRNNGHPEVIDDSEVVARVEDLSNLLQESAPADEIVFCGTSKKDLEDYADILRLCEQIGIRTRIAADFLPPSASAVSLEYFDNLPLITFSTVPEHSIEIVAKRIVDFFVAALGLILLSPVLALIAAAIKFTSQGPVFYRQVRCGLHGRRFRLVKFRTMIHGAEDRLWEIRHLNEMDGPVFKMRNDPRVTPLGRFLRKFSIDELPQLWNVIKGEMSIVGPRAPLPEEVEHYAIGQRRRLSVKPGITCLWQVSGRSDISFQKWMEMDLQYIDNWSFWLDLRIMLKTIPAVFTGRGAR
jgi:exopolysaccharide biosynthesis polyprenyl glycosylphosphotransferase